MSSSESSDDSLTSYCHDNDGAVSSRSQRRVKRISGRQVRLLGAQNRSQYFPGSYFFRLLLADAAVFRALVQSFEMEAEK